jgi:protein pelota
MRIIHKDIKKGIVKIRIQNLNDLWYLSHIIDAEDFVSGKTLRKIKTGAEDDRNIKTHTRKVWLKIQVEKLEFHRYSDKLRASGKIVDGPDDVPRGSYHTFNLEPAVEVTIEKEKWLKFQLDKLNEAASRKPAQILICILDREKAIFSEMKNYGYEVLSEIRGNVQKKDSPERIKQSSFYRDIINTIKGYDNKKYFSKIIIASPAFWREYLFEVLEKDEIKKKIITATCNSVDLDGINEVLRRPEIITALKDDVVVREMNLVEELLTEINKDGLSAYGLKETEVAINAGAVRSLLVTDKIIISSRENGTYQEIDDMLKKVDDMKGEINIISSEHDGGRKLDGLGGIGALLRYRVS